MPIHGWAPAVTSATGPSRRCSTASSNSIMGRVLSIVYRTISMHLTRKAGYTKTTAQTGAVTLIQRFGSALNLNIHFHMLFLDGAYVDSGKFR